MTTMSPEDVRESLQRLKALAAKASSDEEMREITSRIAQVTRAYRIQNGIGIPATPDAQALELDRKYVSRPHLTYLGERIAEAVRDVERGKNRMIAVSMPPRAGKSTLLSFYTPLWLLRRHPEWDIMTASHDGSLTGTWARNVRTIIEKNPDLGIALKKDGGAGTEWKTVEDGGLYSTSVRGSLTGRGGRVLIIDDPVKDFIDSHSQSMRNMLWNWWLSVAQTRLEAPYLVISVMTRWHEDDFIGRLFDPEMEGDPKTWEKISLPAIAEEDDPLGRTPGQPLLSPLVEESEPDALVRWENVRQAVGSYTFSSMYQQRPAPARGAIFDAGWWRYWTTDYDKVTEDGRVVYLDPSSLTGGKWIDSWDLNFESNADAIGGWVVGQRWVRNRANRYLISQQRGRWTFTQTIDALKKWARTEDINASPCGHLVHTRLIEKKANGAAAIDVLKDEISGIKPIHPRVSKEARARVVTPEIESGNVYLPHPNDPGNEWVTDFLSEVRNFPHDVSDDQVDAMTQALTELRDEARGGITVPGGTSAPRPITISRNIASAARSGRRRV